MRRRFLADVRLLDGPRPRLCDPPRPPRLGRVRAQMDRGSALPRRLLGLCRAEETGAQGAPRHRSEEHTSELQSLMRISYAVFCLKKKKKQTKITNKHPVSRKKHQPNHNSSTQNSDDK